MGIREHALIPLPILHIPLRQTVPSEVRQEALSVAAVSVGHVPEAVVLAVHVMAAASVVTDNGKRYV